MQSRQKGFVIPIVLVFMVISHLVYMGIVHISLMQTKHATLLKDYYQQSLQLVAVEQLVTPSLEIQENDLSHHFSEEIDLFKQELLAGISTENPIIEDHQFGVYEVELNSDEISHLYVFTISVLSHQAYPFSESEPTVDIQVVSDSDYYSNQFHQSLLYQTNEDIKDYFTQLEDNHWQMTDYYELMSNNQWKMSSSDLSRFIFDDGWVEITNHEEYIEFVSHLYNQATPIQSTIPLKSYDYRLFGQIWQYTFSADESTTDE